MQQKQNQAVNKEPLQSHFGNCRGVFAFQIAFSCGNVDDKRPDERHENRCRGVETWCSVENIDCKANEKSVDDESPMRCVERQKHHKKHINARMDKVSQPDVVDNQHL